MHWFNVKCYFFYVTLNTKISFICYCFRIILSHYPTKQTNKTKKIVLAYSWQYFILLACKFLKVISIRRSHTIICVKRYLRIFFSSFPNCFFVYLRAHIISIDTIFQENVVNNKSTPFCFTLYYFKKKYFFRC